MRRLRLRSPMLLILALPVLLLLAGPVGAQTTTVTFDNPVPPGSSGSLMGAFQGLDFGVGQWRWEDAYAADPTRHVYFASSVGTSRTFTFSPGPQTLVSVRVFAGVAGTLTLTDNLGQTRGQAITVGTMQLVTTGWTQPSTTVTVNFTGGWDLGLDDIVYTSAAGQSFVSAISPSAAVGGGPAFTLVVSGGGFAPDSIVRWNGAARLTTFVSASQLTAAIPATDVAVAGLSQVTVFTASAGGATTIPEPFSIIEPGVGFFDAFNRPDSASIGNGWTEKFPNAFAIQEGMVTSIDTGTIDYHDAIVYRPVAEDQRDVEVGLEFRIFAGQNFPQVHARVQRSTITQPNTLNGYLLFVDGFEPSPGRAIIARQQAVTGQFECYMLAIPFPSPLQETDQYRLRFRLTGANPVTLTGIVERLDGTTWEPFASGTTIHTNATQRDPNLYCDPGFLPAPISTAGAVGFAKWRTNNEVLDNFYWIALGQASNPAPTTTGLSPASATAGGPAFTLTVNGSNFVPGSTVRWNTADRPTTFVSAGQLTAPISAADIATAGTAAVTVFTPAPGGGTSNAQTFLMSIAPNPAPTTTSLSPTGATAGGAAFTLTVNGTNFIDGSVVRWNGADRPTTFGSAMQLTAPIPASDLVTAGTPAVVVFTPAPGGGTSNAQTFTVAAAPNPAPATTGLNPTVANVGGPAFTLTVSGTNFVGGSVVRWNGANRTTTFVSPTQLTAAIPAGDLAAAGTPAVTVFTPAPGGGTSNAQTFTVNNLVPTTTSLTPASATAGGAAFTLTVNGTNFVNGSAVRWNGADRPTTFVSATQLTAAIPASDVATAGTAQVTVFNPAPGGGTSNALPLTIASSVTTTVTFDSPVPPGSSDSFLNGSFEGINFGTNQWRWETAYLSNPTRHIYFASSSGTSRTFTFSPGPRTLVSMRVFTGVSGTLTLTDNLGQTRTQAITMGSLQLVTTGWTQASTTVTVTFTAGWDLGVDDIVYRNP